MSQPVNRRALLGYAGAAGVGGAAGFLGGRVTARDEVPDAAVRVAGLVHDPHGPHQPGILTPSPASHRLVALDLLPGTDAAALGRLMRVWTPSIRALMAGRAAPGDTAADLALAGVSMSVLVAFGEAVFELEGLEKRRPAGFQQVPAMDHDRLEERWVGGDLLLWVCADDDTSVAYGTRRLLLDAAPFASHRWTQSGSWRGIGPGGAAATGRNLFGQLDGTGNPVGDALDAAVWSRDGWLAGGTQLVVRRIRMDLDHWDTAIRDRQEKSTGRRLDTGAPLHGADEHEALDLSLEADGVPVIPLDAHARRAHPSENRGRAMLRRSANYSHVDDSGTATSGLIFAAFQASIAEQFIPVQRRLDQLDALNEWTTAIGSAAFVVPPGYGPEGYVGETLLA